MEIKHPLVGRPPVVDWDIFDGDVGAEEILAATAGGGVRVYDVVFPPGTATVWHTHSVDQLLIVIAGEGVVATGDEERIVRVGDVIAFPAGERHRHGATAASEMRHLAIMNPGEDLL